jgi:transposase
MEQSIVAGSEVAVRSTEPRRRWRTVEEKLRIVEEAMVPGASVARVARLHGVNANQVFAWRRQYQAGELVVPGTSGPKLLPVIVADSAEREAKEELDQPGGSIHIEFPGRALVSIEAGVDLALAAAVVERLARWSSSRREPGSGSLLGLQTCAADSMDSVHRCREHFRRSRYLDMCSFFGAAEETS